MPACGRLAEFDGGDFPEALVYGRLRHGNAGASDTESYRLSE